MLLSTHHDDFFLCTVIFFLLNLRFELSIYERQLMNERKGIIFQHVFVLIICCSCVVTIYCGSQFLNSNLIRASIMITMMSWPRFLRTFINNVRFARRTKDLVGHLIPNILILLMRARAGNAIYNVPIN